MQQHKNWTATTTAVIAATIVAGYLAAAPVSKYLLAHVGPHTIVPSFRVELLAYNVEHGPKQFLGYQLEARNRAGTRFFQFHNANTTAEQGSRQLITAFGQKILLNDADRSKSTTMISDPAELDIVHQAASELTTCTTRSRQLLGHEIIGGQNAEILQFSGRDLHIKDWRIPSLGCVLVKYVIERPGPDGTFHVGALGEAKSVDLAEPPAEWFDFHRDYTEVKPSTFEVRLRQSLGVPETTITEGQRKELYKRDEAYGLMAHTTQH